MALALIAVLTGFVLLAWSADRFVYGASHSAQVLGISPLIIGLTIVAFGTSAPELFVSAAAALQGNTSLAIGNAVGSNITNLGLVIGLTAVLHGFVIRSTILRREFPIMIMGLAIAAGLLWDLQLSRTDSLILTALLLAFIGWTIWVGLHEKTIHPEIDTQDELGQEHKESLNNQANDGLGHALLWLATGLILLIISSKLLVWGAVEVATLLGISDLIIGLTIVAIGTSLPEVATTIASVRKQADDIAIGNIVGSNIFNILGVIGIAGLIHPTNLESVLMSRDYMVMLGVCLLVIIFALNRRINRAQGVLLLLSYLAYLGLLVYQTVAASPA